MAAPPIAPVRATDQQAVQVGAHILLGEDGQAAWRAIPGGEITQMFCVEIGVGGGEAHHPDEIAPLPFQQGHTAECLVLPQAVQLGMAPGVLSAMQPMA